MTPIERAARAMMNVTGRDGSPLLTLDPDFNELPDRVHMLADDDFCREDMINLVRAVLTEIREPTHAMQAAAFAQKVSFRSGSGMSDVGQVSVEYESEPDKGAATLWTAMIDAMLEEG